ncbi:hypothetical protein RR48_00127 [Papilio machaon]|uniref:Uncharacterized protein n=1 Tax=Papilio machaon TaxID=76193 RepID=A0A0N1IDZ7_PAPMA|nr:hypothetical protein RR48_00127 [Papilio machaon]
MHCDGKVERLIVPAKIYLYVVWRKGDPDHLSPDDPIDAAGDAPTEASPRSGVASERRPHQAPLPQLEGRYKSYAAPRPCSLVNHEYFVVRSWH